ncbi:SDR family NAD(P)-dependent oxidoreductase [Pacificibacter marinus]|uniref:3-oxoacyl-[acyl-carrier-protein] reductase FabG n=1 Tax=Pacificibacter marinus TaxID=658057 RepID=A0A1Y5SRC2_9RHOB|nr:SDR family oxidoreductase [Pacificibacter marinus]SEK66816.1 3-oxoacyl-[acyl-carrier protein] reductase [Pacificibacter marinus]SLN46659.1 3-oxoacyl-[acyl-carrier-protein] reductase FabG [Pacificibacter marinus]
MTQRALVTGGDAGIGRTLALAFADNGYDVGFTYLTPSTHVDSLVVDVAKRGHKAFGFQSDAGDAGAVTQLYVDVENAMGGAPDVLVNNAGIQTWSPLLDLDVADFDRVIRTNLRGCFLNTQIAAKHMIAAGKQGAIINLGSGCNKLGFPNLSDYTASKGGIEQFTKASAMELGPYGIRVNCVAPGAIATDRTADETEGYAEKWSALTPLRRVGTPQDMAGPVVFLASDAAAFVTGQTLYVDGGVFSSAPWPQEY